MNIMLHCPKCNSDIYFNIDLSDEFAYALCPKCDTSLHMFSLKERSAEELLKIHSFLNKCMR